MKKTGIKVLRGMAYVLFVGFMVLCMMEVAYRQQWIDFYKSEFTALNQDMPDDCSNKILIFGDSFSAQQEGYVNIIRESLPQTCIYNASVPGIGIVQTQLTAQKRLEQIKPNLVIYQMYLGNDLIDIHHPINWSKLSLGRNFYWWLSDRFRVVAYLNHRLGQLSHAATQDINKDYDSKKQEEFSIAQYSPRTKLYLKSDPYYLEKSVTGTNDYHRRIEKLIEGIAYMRSIVPVETEFIILPIPHCSQLNEHYLGLYQDLGAQFSHLANYSKAEYGLLKQLKRHFKNDDIHFINPLEELKENDTPAERLYYANDPHLNGKGHQILGNFVLPYIQNSLK